MYKKRQTRFNWELALCLFFLWGFIYLEKYNITCMGKSDFIILSAIGILSIGAGKLFKTYKDG